jgi:hypothetical protein
MITLIRPIQWDTCRNSRGRSLNWPRFEEIPLHKDCNLSICKTCGKYVVGPIVDDSRLWILFTPSHPDMT